MPGFQNYRSFESEESARAIIGLLLEDAGIPYHISSASTDHDVMFAKSATPMNIWLQLYPHDFIRANQMLEQRASEVVVLNKSHFLNSYTDQELRDVIYRSDEWSPEDYAMAGKILESRGIPYTRAELDTLRSQRLAEIRTPKSGTWLVITGFAVLILGGILSVILGWGLYSSTSTDPTGRKYYDYDEPSRRKGLMIMISGIVVLLYYAVRLVMM
jgi:hypothetical protein